jgi:hypothetical protein
MIFSRLAASRSFSTNSGLPAQARQVARQFQVCDRSSY